MYLLFLFALCVPWFRLYCTGINTPGHFSYNNVYLSFIVKYFCYVGSCVMQVKISQVFMYMHA